MNERARAGMEIKLPPRTHRGNRKFCDGCGPASVPGTAKLIRTGVLTSFVTHAGPRERDALCARGPRRRNNRRYPRVPTLESHRSYEMAWLSRSSLSHSSRKTRDRDRDRQREKGDAFSNLCRTAFASPSVTWPRSSLFRITVDCNSCFTARGIRSNTLKAKSHSSSYTIQHASFYSLDSFSRFYFVN